MAKVKNEFEDIFGDITGVTVGSDDSLEENQIVYPFNCPPIDIPFGGGIFGGKIYELFGEESHGKSTFALDIVKIFADFYQKAKDNRYCIFWIESESAFDMVRAQYMGFPISRTVFFKTDVFEDGRDKIKEVLDRCIKKNMKLLIVWDTIAAVSTRNEKSALEFDEDEDDSKKKNKTNPGGLTEKPRLLKQMLRDITVPLGQTQSTIVFVNQVIQKIGSYIPGVDSTGGRGFRHHASVRARIARVDEKEIIDKAGQKTIEAIISEISFAKNKLTGYTKFRIPVYIDLVNGVNYLETRLLFMKKSKLLVSSGGWTTFKIPAKYATEPTAEPEMIELKFQTAKQLANLVQQYPQLIDWWDFLVYKQFIQDSPLVKVKNIDHVWKYEEKFYGQRLTKLSEKEQTAATIMYADLIKSSDVEKPAEGEDNAPGGKPPKKK